ncbi:molybdate ABC transporter substrate-binding protein [Candidatus Nitronereus thalassa]|uniref:Molybdate ABC transporter substrate-binding protein n=1 Tax=Candidatus Nitronereus thalassa TaxID=3020898 RepID=A0ABU3K4Z0_9BACT|nr:molybdate ABC transporter substrate-binding protein [Candidatus Nitronereus thalassa]MDT7041470.1 molybdate ABC transporter substrate-binding protein [Candidatus Nitronereus thalassa]
MLIKNLVVILIAVSQWLPVMANAGEVRIAVAANFRSTLNEIVRHFEEDSGHKTLVSSGSSGKLYVQIKNGAPFDVFLSADAQRPAVLEDEGFAVPHSRFTYAVGRLTLWSANPDLIKGDGKAVLAKGGFNRLAIANPKTAPYGLAAKTTLQAMGLWNQLKGRLVQGENIGQVFQFVYSSNAQLGFVALAQVLDPKINGMGSRWDVPESFHDALGQQAVLLTRGKSNIAAIEFVHYLKSPKAQALIEQLGYGVE